MGESSPDRNVADDLQFTTAEPATAGAALTPPSSLCAACQQPIVSTYYALADKLLCPSCCAQINTRPAGTRFGRLAKATFLGFGAGLIGAIGWFLIRRIAHLEIGLVALLVGFMVGKGVLKGSGFRGGRGYQVLAVLITYCCIAFNYMPDVLEAFFKVARERREVAKAVMAEADKADADRPAVADEGHTPRKPAGFWEIVGAYALLVAVVFGISAAAPFLAGMENIIGLLIIAIALWEAWKLAARRQLPLSGPYELKPATA